jgi:hypothetical protein
MARRARATVQILTEARPDHAFPHRDLPHDDVRVEIEATAAAAGGGADFPTEYVDRVREQSARFALRTAAPDDIRAAVALLEEQSNVQALAPVDSRNRGVATAKQVVRKAVFFAVNHLSEQVRALGWAATSVGEAAAERIEQLEARVLELESRLRDLENDS